MLKAYKRILIINTFGIGDVLFSTPMVKALKDSLPWARIDFICNARTQPILKNNKNIDDVIVFEKDDFREVLKKSKADFIKKCWRAMKRIRSKRYDLAIDLSLGYQISLILKLLGIRERIGFNYRKRGRFLTRRLCIEGFNDKPVAAYYMDVVGLIGVVNNSLHRLDLALSPEAKRAAEYFVLENGLAGRVLVGLVPGGGKSWGEKASYRRWKPENFVYVARGIADAKKDASFLIFGSDEERSLGDSLTKGIGGNAFNLCGGQSLEQSAALIKRCRILLCNEGGMLHVAVSQDVKTISIFGPVDSNVYGPYPAAKEHTVITAEGLSCRPCYKNFRQKPCDRHDCLKMIDRDKVLSAALKQLG